MKRLISLLLIINISFILLCFNYRVKAVNDVPVYDSTFDGNKGAFYANGTPITIDKDELGNTVITWNEGKEIVPSTVTVFGGGKEGTSYETSNITMKDGVVTAIHGGGISLNENTSSSVGESNVTIDNGTVLTSLYGGGLIYTNVKNTNVTINGGRISAISGGGKASGVISGVAYSAGSEDDLINSKNRVDNASIQINGEIIDKTPSDYGLLYGGGQGYSYTGNAKIVINDGDLSKAYVTAGGSNGYTGNSTVEVNGGNILFLQTVNRGQLNEANVKINDGTISTAYIGGEPDPTVTGNVDKVEFNILGGKVTDFSAGTSNLQPIEVEQEKYKTVMVKDTVINNNVGGKSVTITYNFDVLKDEEKLRVGEIKKIDTKITTTPEGYEELFENNQIMWNSDNPEIVSVNDKGQIKGISQGDAIVTAKLLEQEKNVKVSVTSNYATIIITIALFLLFIILSIIILVIN